MNLIYYIILLSILFFTLFLIHKSYNKAPKKIKVLLIASLTLFSLRSITLLLMCVIKDAYFIHYLKYCINLNYLYVPILISILYYVNFRFDNMSFNTNYIIALIITAFYLLTITLNKAIVRVDLQFGYIMELSNSKLVSILMIVLLGAFLLTGLLLIDKKNSKKWNIILIIAITFIFIIESLAITIKVWIFPYVVVSELLLIFIINKSLNTFKAIK